MNVPHVLEMIFFSLDYKSYANCKKVSNMWRELLAFKSFQQKANSIYIQERVKNEKELMKCRVAKKVQNLLSIGVDPNCQNSWGLTPLYFACKNGKPAVVKLLLDAGADPNKITSKNFNYPLYVVVQWVEDKNHTSVVKLLLEAGADPNKRSNNRTAPLHVASSKCNIEVAKLLLNAGADPNIPDGLFGCTPLHSALMSHFNAYHSDRSRGTDLQKMESEFVKMVEVLVKAGADPCLSDYEGISALDLAKTKGQMTQVKIVQLLEDLCKEKL